MVLCFHKSILYNWDLNTYSFIMASLYNKIYLEMFTERKHIHLFLTTCVLQKYYFTKMEQYWCAMNVIHNIISSIHVFKIISQLLRNSIPHSFVNLLIHSNDISFIYVYHNFCTLSLNLKRGNSVQYNLQHVKLSLQCAVRFKSLQHA